MKKIIMGKSVIIALGSMAGVGKDLIGEYLVENQDFKRMAFGDLLKDDVAKQNNISVDYLEQNKEQYRSQLISYGEGKRKNDPLYWVNKTFEGVDLGNLEQSVILTDVRRIDELKWLKDMNEKYDNVYIFEVIKPKHWDEDIETIKSIVYGNYYNCYYGRIINMGTKEELYEIVDNVLTNIQLTMNVDENPLLN